MSIFAHDHSLPALPVPDLQESCDALLALASPLNDEAVMKATRAAVEDFRRDDGPGALLQKALRQRAAAQCGNASWLRPLWDDMYRAWRGTLPLEMNYYFCFDPARWGGGAALPRLCRALAGVFQQLAHGNLPPEQTRAGYMSMDQARSAVYTRVPGASSDVLIPLYFSGPQHLAVVCRGHWFTVPLQCADGELVSETTLSATFTAIRKAVEALPEAVPLGAMTSVPRAEAARLREKLQYAARNRLSLELLEKSLFVVCLDPPCESDEELNRAMLSGDAACRCFDKSLQIIAPHRGGLGANFEHAGCDAAIWLYLLTQADADLMGSAQSDLTGDEAASAAADALADSLAGNHGLQPEAAASAYGRGIAYTQLQWDIPRDLAEELHTLRKAFAARADTIRLECAEFPELARNGLKQLKTSPDAFLQTAFQAAQLRLFGTLRSSYEAVATRAFAFGRTECARGSTEQAKVFAKALWNREEDETVRSLYRKAEQAHLDRLLLCQQGKGVERHMYGLAVMYDLYGQELGLAEKPAIFSDPGWLTVKHDALSTSGIGAPFIRFFGFGPVVADGLGIGYAPGKDCTGLAVTAVGKDSTLARDFMAGFAEAARRIATLLS